MTKTRAFAILLILVAMEGVMCYECPEELKQTCEECNIDNKCVQCRLGFYLEDGICISCLPGCIECLDRDLCQVCTVGYALNMGKCEACQTNCLTCEFEANYCTSCREDYKLDTKNTCHFKYAMILFLCALGLVIFVITFLLVGIKKCAARRSKNKPQNYGSVLDDETSSKQKFVTVVQDVQDIGKTNDLNDISVVGTVKGGSTVKSFLEPQQEVDDDPNEILSHLVQKSPQNSRKILVKSFKKK